MPGENMNDSTGFGTRKPWVDRELASPAAGFKNPIPLFDGISAQMPGSRFETADIDILAPGPFPLGQKKIDAEYDYYESLVKRNGGGFEGEANKKNLVAIRHETSTFANGGNGVYDDTAVLLWVDDAGTKRVRKYRANTDPTARYLNDNHETEDVNGDGKRELGRLPAGSYAYIHNWFKNKHDTVGNGNVFTMPEGSRFDAEYDTNQDGFFNDNARAKGGETMFWHGGRESDVASAGCQTMHPDDWNRFIEDMNVSVVDKVDPFSDPVSLNYTLINEDSSRGNVPYRDPNIGPVSSNLQSSIISGFGSSSRMLAEQVFAAGNAHSLLAAITRKTFAAGGDVKGKGSSIGDKIPAYLSDGEFVMNARSTAVNRPFLQALNADPYFLHQMLARASERNRSDDPRGYGRQVSSNRSATVNISMSSQEDIIPRLKVLSQQWELMHAC